MSTTYNKIIEAIEAKRLTSAEMFMLSTRIGELLYKNCWEMRFIKDLQQKQKETTDPKEFMELEKKIQGWFTQMANGKAYLLKDFYEMKEIEDYDRKHYPHIYDDQDPRNEFMEKDGEEVANCKDDVN
jgi:hypothetical protein